VSPSISQLQPEHFVQKLNETRGINYPSDLVFRYLLLVPVGEQLSQAFHAASSLCYVTIPSEHFQVYAAVLYVVAFSGIPHRIDIGLPRPQTFHYR
jgi:hypothetical protein